MPLCLKRRRKRPDRSLKQGIITFIFKVSREFESNEDTCVSIVCDLLLQVLQLLQYCDIYNFDPTVLSHSCSQQLFLFYNVGVLLDAWGLLNYYSIYAMDLHCQYVCVCVCVCVRVCVYQRKRETVQYFMQIDSL